MNAPAAVVAFVVSLVCSTATAQVPNAVTADGSRAGWLVPSVAAVKVPPPLNERAERAELAAIVAARSDADIARARWWSVGGSGHRWNEIAVDAMLDDFVTLPLAARHLALVHAAIDDAVAVAWANKRAFQPQRPPAALAAWPMAAGASYPSDHAAAASAAAEVLAYLLPERAAAFATKADEAMRSRLVAGAEYPRDVAAGREIGRQVAALAIARGRADGSDAKWSGSVPPGDGRWRGESPIAPMAASWRTWVLDRPDEFRSPAPPAFDSERTRADLAELKSFKRTPRTNHRATYWEVFGGARAHALWNETARLKLLEYADAFDTQSSARVLAALNIAFADAAVACWDAKYAYWYIRPSQLDPDLKPLFAPPNHPSFPAAHGCLSTAAATVLASAFPADRERLLALGTEAAEARIWAGIHYRFDIDAGQELGRRVAEKVIARAFGGALRVASTPR